MKQLYLITTLFLTVTVVHGVLSSLASLGQGFSNRGSQILQDRVTGLFSNLTIAFDLHSDLNFFRRQEECQSGYYPCASEPDCCPTGDSCTAIGCCQGGDIQCGSEGCYNPQSEVCCEATSRACPAGQVCVDGGCCPTGETPCGSTKCYDPTTTTCCQNSTSAWGCPLSDKCCSNGFCYNPTSEQCCETGSCLQQDSCCANQCCRSIAYCASDGYCSACPLLATETATASIDSTIWSTNIVTITQISEPESLPPFTCFPLTVTNAVNATLKLGTGCKLSYIAPSTPTSTPTPTSAPPKAMVRPRQFSCVPITTITTTTTVVNEISSVTTMSVTVFESSEPGFSCTPMTVTNQFGDLLSLDKSCALGFSAATPSSTSSPLASSPAAANGPNQAGPSSAARSGVDNRVSVWGVMMIALFGIVL